MQTKYSTGTFQAAYIQHCNQASVPLNEEQIGALERTIAEFFGVKTKREIKELPSIDIKLTTDIKLAMEIMDLELLERVGEQQQYKQPRKVLSVVHNYRAKHSSDAEFHNIPTNADAFELYQQALILINVSSRRDPFSYKSSLPLLKVLRQQLPYHFNYKIYKILHAYLHEKGLVKEEEPPKARKLRE